LPYYSWTNAAISSHRSATAIHLERDTTYIWYSVPTGALTFVNERTADFLGLPENDPLRFGIDVGGAWDLHIPLLRFRTRWFLSR
jgi:hypothetical protein